MGNVSDGKGVPRLPACCFHELMQSGYFVGRSFLAGEVTYVQATPASDRFFGRKIMGRKISSVSIFLPEA